jgi:hypothetical protein
LRCFRKWQEKHDPEFPHAEALKTHRVPGRIPREGPAWLARGGRQYGEPLHLYGMQHTPINEQGVLFLFAAMAGELGYVVESLTAGFPDCEAKRRVGKVWERVRIEFEYQSRNFRDHRHDHSVPTDLVLRRYNKGLANLRSALELTDRCFVIDNTGNRFRLLLTLDDGKVRHLSRRLPAWALLAIPAALRNAAH